jgi:hypothetical protein
MVEEAKSGRWETARLLEDRSVEVYGIVFTEDCQSHGEKIVKVGTPEYDAVILRHPNLKPGIVDEIELPLSPNFRFEVAPEDIIVSFDPNDLSKKIWN